MSESRHEASPFDGKEILRILESSAAKGSIELIYTRRPDAYESYMKESGEARVFVSKNGESAVGTCAELIREVYIDGEIRKAAYICGLKKDSDYSGSIGFGAKFIMGLTRDDIDFYYCSVVSDNIDARKMFEKSRRILSMNQIVEYKTYILNPKVSIKAPKHSYTFRRASGNDQAKLIDFLNTEGMKKDMFPVIKTLDQFFNLKTEDFYLLLDGDCIIATAALWNQTEYKQYVVKRYGGAMRLARIFNPLLATLKFIKLPKANQSLDFPMLSFFISQNDNEDYYKIMLNYIKREIASFYDMFVIGLPKNHFASSLFDKLPSVSFETKLYEIRFPLIKQNYISPDVKKMFFECGLL